MSERSRSRSPLKSPISTTEESKAEDPSTQEARFIYIANLPRFWNYKKACAFIYAELNKTSRIFAKSEFSKFRIVSMHELNDGGESRTGGRVIQLFSEEACQRILKELDGVDCEGEKLLLEGNAVHRLSAGQIEHANKLYRKSCKHFPKKEKEVKVKREIAKEIYRKINPQPIKVLTPKLDQPANVIEPATVFPPKKISPEVFVNHETYGLSAKYLADLGILPPLNNRIYIKNLSAEVTETKLREILSYAGHVLAAQIFPCKNTMIEGKVLYDHPVEAVQAIAMFNNRELFGKPMNLRMDRYKLQIPLLPLGLSSIGNGLGPGGAPLAGVRNKMELEIIKKSLREDLAKLQENLNRYQSLVQQQNSSVNPQDNALTSAVDLIKLLHNKFAGNGASSAGNTQAPQSRFDIPPNPMVLSQNPWAIQQNPMSVGQNAVTNFQQSMVHSQSTPPLTNFQPSMVHSQTTPQSRFDIPPNALTIAQNTSMTSNVVVQNWGAGQSDWSQQPQTQSLSQPSNGYDNTRNYGTWAQVQPTKTQTVQSESGTCEQWVDIQPPQTQKPQAFGKSKYKPDEFDKERFGDSDKSERKGDVTSTDMLLFKNLPASVTSQALVNKMSELGELKFAEITGEGRAVVRYQNVRDAERCIHLYDRSKVDGQTIMVKYF